MIVDKLVEDPTEFVENTFELPLGAKSTQIYARTDVVAGYTEIVR